jgi:LPPG:FO 2-phospho-L-lactate transferase
MAQGRWWPFQEFMIRGAGAGPVEGVEFRGAAVAHASAEVLEAIETARAILIGPSNPIASIGPILAVSGLSDALRRTTAPVVALSPIVRGAIVKGPTAAFMQWAGQPLSSDGIAAVYEGLIDGLVADEPTASIPALETEVLMDTPEARRSLAERALSFALEVR